MDESKIELTERLRREGRWGEASRFKDEALRACRAKGNTRAVATPPAGRRAMGAPPFSVFARDPTPSRPAQYQLTPSPCQ